MNDRADRIRRRLEAATPAPWSQGMVGDHLINEVDYSASFGFVVVNADLSDDGQNGRADAAFIADAPEDIAWLLAERDAAVARAERAEAALRAVVKAVDDSGQHTEYHWSVVDRTRADWPTLMYAIDAARAVLASPGATKEDGTDG